MRLLVRGSNDEGERNSIQLLYMSRRCIAISERSKLAGLIAFASNLCRGVKRSSIDTVDECNLLLHSRIFVGL